jgi:hypothetical protein
LSSGISRAVCFEMFDGLQIILSLSEPKDNVTEDLSPGRAYLYLEVEMYSQKVLRFSQPFPESIGRGLLIL